MRSIWTAISLLAVANLLALLGFVGWLQASGRLNMDRVREARTLFTRTLADQKREADAAKSKAEGDLARAEAEARSRRAPMSATEQLAARLGAREIDEQRVAAFRAEVAQLRAALEQDSRELEKRLAALDQTRKAFDAMVADHNARVGEAQFKKAISVLENLKAADARAALQQIIERGPAADTLAGAATSGAGEPGARAQDPPLTAQRPAAIAQGTPSPGDTSAGKRRAVEYLNALKERTRAKVMAEFTKDDPGLAAELLELLRSHGAFARAPEAPPR